MVLYENKEATFHATKRLAFSCNPHLHHHIELLYISQGDMDVVVNDQAFPATAGDLIFVFPNQIHSFQDRGSMRGYIVIVSPDDFPEFSSVFRHSLPATPILPQVSREIHRLFRNICQHTAEESAYCSEIQRGYTLALLGLLVPQLDLHPQSTPSLSVVQNVLLYCDNHYAEPLSLETLARQFGVSRFYVSHIFSDKIKVSFTAYIHRLRIQAAKQLLAQGTPSVTEVAYRVGYGSIRSFNRQFSSMVGQSPSAYRRQQTGV